MRSIKRLGLIMLLIQGLMFTFNTSLPGQKRQLDLKWNPFFWSGVNPGSALSTEFYLPRKIKLELGLFASPGFYYITDGARRLPEVYSIWKYGLMVAPRRYIWAKGTSEGFFVGLNATALPFGRIANSSVNPPFYFREDEALAKAEVAYFDFVLAAGIGYKKYFGSWLGEINYTLSLLRTDPQYSDFIQPKFNGVSIKIGHSL